MRNFWITRRDARHLKFWLVGIDLGNSTPVFLNGNGEVIDQDKLKEILGKHERQESE